MRLEDMLKDVSGITQKVVDSNCFQGANTLLENILLIQTKVNEVIKAINDGIIKGDKGDKGDKGETGSKGDKGDTGKATESIQDNVTSLDTTWSSTKIDSFFNDIKNIQGVKYGNDVGYQVCKGTHNGIVKDIKVYGKSLVNGWRISEWMKVNTQIVATDKVGTSVMPIIKKDNIFNIGDVITIVADISVDNSSNCYWQVNYMSTTGEEKSLKNIPFSSGVKTFTIQLPSDFAYMQCIFVGVHSGNTRTFKNNGCMCIKGDLKGCIPSYFEGIVSVGNGNEIEVLSTNNGNLLDKFDITVGYYLGSTNGNSYPNATSFYTNKYVEVSPGVMFYSNNNCIHVFYDKDKRYISGEEKVGWVKIPYNAKYVRFSFYNKNHLIDSLYCGYTDNVNLFFNIEDKKTILFKDTDNTWKPITNLRGIDENNCDVVDSVNGKFDEKIGVTTLNGNETTWVSRSQPVDTNLFRIALNLNGKYKKGSLLLCDKFKNTINDYNVEGISIHGVDGYLDIVISKTKASSLETIKQYFQNNNTTFFGVLTEPKQYEINPLFPQSFDNETMILFNTGVIPCKNEFYIDSNLGSLQIETNERLSRIENFMYQSNIAILRGDFRTLAQMYYPNDFIKKEELPNE